MGPEGPRCAGVVWGGSSVLSANQEKHSDYPVYRSKSCVSGLQTNLLYQEHSDSDSKV